MGVYLRLFPGLKIRLTKRGMRTSIGPRAARLHVGAGGTGISTGAGPVSIYHGVGKRKRRRSQREGPKAGKTAAELLFGRPLTPAEQQWVEAGAEKYWAEDLAVPLTPAERQRIIDEAGKLGVPADVAEAQLTVAEAKWSSGPPTPAMTYPEPAPYVYCHVIRARLSEDRTEVILSLVSDSGEKYENIAATVTSIDPDAQVGPGDRFTWDGQELGNHISAQFAAQYQQYQAKLKAMNDWQRAEARQDAEMVQQFRNAGYVFDRNNRVVPAAAA